VNRHRVASMNQGDNFGLITIDWAHKAVRSAFGIPNVLDLKESKDDPLITLQIRDIEGEIVLRQKLLLSNLRPRALEFGDGRLAKLSTGEPLTRAEAAKHVNRKVTVELKVRGTGASKGGGLVFLNSLADRTLEGNFTVVLDKAALALLKGAGVESPQAYYDGKTLRVTGTLTLFREQPQIVVIDPAQIAVVTEGKQ
jgi:hypothetical protein